MQGSFLQTPFWAEFKSRHGWKYFRFKVSDTDKEEISVLVRTFACFFSLAYIPLAPVCGDNTNINEYFESLIKITEQIKSLLPARTIFIRFDPPVSFSDNFTQDDFKKVISKYSKLNKPVSDIQPPDTVILDLTRTEDEILSEMKSKWRYNIHLAEKKNVQIKTVKVTDSDFEKSIDIFYDLYKTTSERDGIALHSKNYYLDLFKCANENSDSPIISLYLAEHEETPLAAIITLFTPKQAVYLYGASSNEKRNLMPAYLLQWTAICDAKKHGCCEYDFYGIPPTDDESHPMHGLYRFKTGFGGAIVHRVGSVDVPMSPLYIPYSVAEKLRLIWFKKFKKLFRKK
ncbi:MAG: peptidoglycan bridge formation glycyltransferase FemA/FemB family protein [Spirochaetaceae bacterium]|nr:peptidoglycan bridge formation glycyltransferase FemA/FemB family protein [Spirochaetaceae bacterium]